MVRWGVAQQAELTRGCRRVSVPVAARWVAQGQLPLGRWGAHSLHARAEPHYAGLAGGAHSSDSRMVRSLTGMIWRLVVRPPVAAAKAAWKASSCGRGRQQRGKREAIANTTLCVEEGPTRRAYMLVGVAPCSSQRAQRQVWRGWAATAARQ